MIHNDVRVDYFFFAIVLGMFGVWISSDIYGGIWGFALGYALALVNEFGKEFG